jgi:hypothetical protein
MNNSLGWLYFTLGTSTFRRDPEEALRASGETFLASLRRARESVIADGLEVLLSLQAETIGDDPQFGLPAARKIA